MNEIIIITAPRASTKIFSIELNSPMNKTKRMRNKPKIKKRLLALFNVFGVAFRTEDGFAFPAAGFLELCDVFFNTSDTPIVVLLYILLYAAFLGSLTHPAPFFRTLGYKLSSSHALIGQSFLL